MDAEALQRYVDEHNIDAEIVFLQEETPTVEAAAEAVGVQPAQIVKSVLFVVKARENGAQPQLVVTNGLSRVSYRALADYLGVSRRRLRMARASEVEEMTGYKVGTVPPFGHKSPIPTVVDETVPEQEEVYVGGGGINALMRLSVTELQRVLQADIVDVSK